MFGAVKNSEQISRMDIKKFSSKKEYNIVFSFLDYQLDL
jgi:hypothetical protein